MEQPPKTPWVSGKCELEITGTGAPFRFQKSFSCSKHPLLQYFWKASVLLASDHFSGAELPPLALIHLSAQP